MPSGHQHNALSVTAHRKKRIAKESQEASDPLQPISDTTGVSPANPGSHLMMASRPGGSASGRSQSQSLSAVVSTPPFPYFYKTQADWWLTLFSAPIFNFTSHCPTDVKREKLNNHPLYVNAVF